MKHITVIRAWRAQLTRAVSANDALQKEAGRSRAWAKINRPDILPTDPDAIVCNEGNPHTQGVLDAVARDMFCLVRLAQSSRRLAGVCESAGVLGVALVRLSGLCQIRAWRYYDASPGGYWARAGRYTETPAIELQDGAIDAAIRASEKAIDALEARLAILEDQTTPAPAAKERAAAQPSTANAYSEPTLALPTVEEMKLATGGMTAKQAIVLQHLIEHPTASNREVETATLVPEATVRRWRTEWAERFPGMDNTKKRVVEGRRELLAKGRLLDKPLNN